jgi:hypothetical protein
VRVDIATKHTHLLSKPRNIADANIDGLYFDEDSLVAIQNPDVHPGRVMRYYLDPARNGISRAEVLEAYNPIFDVPTTGALVGKQFYFLANSQLDKRDDEGTMPTLTKLQNIYMLKLKL